MFNRKILFSACLFLLAVFVAACYKVPITNRTQFIVFSEAFERRLGANAYLNVLQSEKISGNKEYARAVTRVGSRIAAVTNTRNLSWQYTVFDDDKQINAFALPGGKIGVYTGMMPVAETDAGLATVLAHEVAHSTARHGGERMSFGILLEIGAAAIAIGMRDKDPRVVGRVLQAYGIGSSLALALPFNRKQESEADRIGLVYMAKAGYDPRQAISFWRRMESSGGLSPPEFLSTHPGYKTRVENLRKWMPEAMEYYERSSKAPQNTILIADKQLRLR